MRNRLTRRNAAVDKTPYPGSVNEERHDPEFEDYVTYDPATDPHEGNRNMGHDWQNNPRNEIGFGIPTQASIRVTASKAVKLASLFLGEKVAEDVLEAQARDFMCLGSKALDNALSRFASTETLYAEDKEEVKEMPKEEVKKEALKDPVKAAEAPKEEPKKEEVKEAPKVAKEEPKKDEMAKDEAVEAAADEEDSESCEAAGKEDELDIEMGSDNMDEDTVKSSKEDDAILASLYADEEEALKVEAPVEKKASKNNKKGISKIGGQPLMASNKFAGDELNNLWQSAPSMEDIWN